MWLRIWLHLLKKFQMENFIFCAVLVKAFMLALAFFEHASYSSLESVLVPNRFSLFCICSVPIFAKEFSLQYNTFLNNFLYVFHWIFATINRKDRHQAAKVLKLILELLKQVLFMCKRRSKDPANIFDRKLCSNI